MKNQESRLSPESQQIYLDDEIDLLELVAVLWSGKWIILGIILVSGILGFIVIKRMSSIYSIDAILDQTSSYRLERIQPSNLEGGIHYKVQEIAPNTIYSTSLAYANSLYVKRLFWEDLTGEQPSLSESNLSDNDKRFKAFSNSLIVTLPEGRAPESSTLSTLALESEMPIEATELLRSYLNFVDRQTITELTDQLRVGYTASLLRLESDYQSLLAREQQKLEDQLIRLSEAFEVAKALNIVETPYEQVENVELTILDNRLYLLGTRTLVEEINSLKARLDKPLGAFVPLLRDMEHWKEQLERDLKRLENAAELVHAFVIVSPPESSIDPVKPNKLLIFVAVLFASGILGVVIVFTREGIRSYKARNASAA